MHIYGPVPSRRLGQSLGVDLLPAKTCNYSCVYCQLGRTSHFSNEITSFFDKTEIWAELQERIEKVGLDAFEFITFVGNGEPTLSADLGWMIQQVKHVYSKKVAVITNGALLYDPQVQADLLQADVVLPTLDAGNAKLFKLINRPHPTLDFDQIFEGMIDFKKQFKGEIWLEVMLVAGLNDGDTEIEAIAQKITELHPDRVYINVPIRPPAESWVKIPPLARIKALQQKLENIIDISIPEEGIFTLVSTTPKEIELELIETLKRHPMREDQILELIRDKIPEPGEFLQSLLKTQQIKKMIHNDVPFYEWNAYKHA